MAFACVNLEVIIFCPLQSPGRITVFNFSTEFTALLIIHLALAMEGDSPLSPIPTSTNQSVNLSSTGTGLRNENRHDLKYAGRRGNPAQLYVITLCQSHPIAERIDKPESDVLDEAYRQIIR